MGADGGNPRTKVLQKFAKVLEDYGAEAMKSYSETHGEFLAPWDFRILFMNTDSEARWYGESSWVDLELAKRAVQTKSRLNPFRYIDGSSHKSYQYPKRIDENVFSITTKSCPTARGYYPKMPNLFRTTLGNGTTSISEAKYGKQSKLRESYYELDETIHSTLVGPMSFGQLNSLPKSRKLIKYIEEFGVDVTKFFGLPSRIVNPGITNNIASDRCNTMRASTAPSEVGADTWIPVTSANQQYSDPAADRGYISHATALDRVLLELEGLNIATT